MKIKWLGQTSFNIAILRNKGEKMEIAIDNAASGFKNALAGILLLTQAEKKPAKAKDSFFIIEGPGEYEINSVFVRGIEAFNKKQETTTIYLIEAEGLVLCHLGGFGQKELTSEQEEKLGEIDVLMVPIGGGDSLSAKEASAVVSLLEPRVVIPMDYSFAEKQLKTLNEFLTTTGTKSEEVREELNLKKSDLNEQEIGVVVLKP